MDVPHVPSMICMKAFLGILDRVSESHDYDRRKKILIYRTVFS